MASTQGSENRSRSRPQTWKVLLADDEPHIREGLRDFLDWESHHLKVVGEAETALEARQKAFRLHPHIVVADIVMPDRDGIWLARELKNTDDRVRIVFLSAYQKTEYFVDAIRLGAADFLVKPVNEGELHRILDRLVLELERENSQERREQRLRRQLRRNRTVLVDRFFRDLIFGRLTDQTGITEAAARAGVMLDSAGPSYVIVAEVRRGNVDHLFSALETASAIQEAGSVHLVRSYREVVVIFQPNTTAIDGVVRSIAVVAEQLSMHACVAVGPAATDLSDLAQAYSRAHAVAERHTNTDDVDIVPWTERAAGLRHLSVTTGRLLEAVGTMAREQEAEGIKRAIHDLFQHLRDSGTTDENLINGICTDVVLRLAMALSPGNTVDGLNGIAEPLHRIYDRRHLSDKEHLAIEVAERLLADLPRAPAHGVRRVIQEVVDLIETNYMDESLSVVSLADAVSLSPNYMATLFKEETGRTVHEYMLSVRLTRAKQLIKNPRYRTYEVANAVGYGNANYFSKMFKRETGMTPKEFRETVQ